MIKLNKVNLTLLLMASPFIISGCGGASGGDTNAKEASASEVAAQFEVQTSAADQAILDVVQNNTQNKSANWVPTPQNNSNKQFSKTQIHPILTNPIINQKIVSNGDNNGEWTVYDNDPSNATVTSEYNEERGGNVIKVDGDGMKNGYVLGYSFATGSSWNETKNTTIKWSMNFSDEYMVYVRVSTRKGYRYLYYTANNTNYGIAGYDAPHYIHNGLGTTSNDGTWRTFSRDLSADLKRHEADNAITSVDGFFVRGSGLIDDIDLLQTNGDHINEVIYEDGEDGATTGWSVYDTDPSGATISNDNKSIKLTGSNLENGYILGGWDENKGWKNTINKEISWDMKYGENYVIYINVETTQGHRFITYTPFSGCGKKEEGGYTYIHLGLNSDTKNGTWQTVTRNLETDLKKYEPNNSIVSVNAFLVRGSGNIDNVKMFDTNGDGDFDNSTN